MPTTSLSGFPELLPAERFVELAVIDRLRRVFELHGFAPIETRAVEPLDRLAKGGEIDKEVYVLRRLHADDADSGGKDADAATLGMHFDLTVPFARYVLEAAGHLQFPFRRYQIQKVWRGERPQEGRYREFTQADIDVIGKDELPVHHDVEVARVMAEALSALEFLPPLRLQVNNRKLIQGFYTGLGAPDVPAVMRTIDKLPAAVVHEQLVASGVEPGQADRCLELAGICSSDTGFVAQVRALGVSDPLLDEGLDELATLLDACRPLVDERVRVEADLRIARGLDYYTGTVFETRLDGSESLGSICSGGRYDALADDGRTTYPGVGISLGVSRVLVPLLQKGALAADRSVPSAVLVAVVDEASRSTSDALATQLRDNGVACEVAAAAQKFGKQIRYAERRGIPYVLFPGDEVQVKDIRSGEQVPVDPATWTPPPHDRTPTVHTSKEHTP
jgi:histidyl-tRNA synthetase